MTVQRRVKRNIDNQGVAITVTHVSGSTFNEATQTKELTTTTENTKGHFRKFSLKEISGLIKEGDRQLRIAVDALSFVPQTNDTVLDVGSNEEFNVVTVDTRTANGVGTLYICVVRGIKA